MNLHTHTSNAGTAVVSMRQPGCSVCETEALIERLSRHVHNWDPYRAGAVDPYKLANLLEGKDGPLDHQRVLSRHERQWSACGGRLTAYVLWGVNWTIGVQVWAGQDYGLFDIDLGPLRFNLYARWGLTEAERTKRWIRRRKP